MKKLIPKYQKGRWMRVKIKNSDPNKPGRYGYVDVDDNNRPWEWDESRPNLFMVHPESPNTEGYWTEIDTSSSQDFNHDTPVYDLSEVIVNPKNREQIATNREIAENNNYYNLFRNASDEILRDWQLQSLRGSTRRLWFDRNGIGHYEFGEQGMSGTDPVGKFYVEGVGIGKAIEGGLQLKRYLKLLRNVPDISVSTSPEKIEDLSSQLDEMYKEIPDAFRRNAIIEYMYTGNKSQPLLDRAKSIDYTPDFWRVAHDLVGKDSRIVYLNEVIPRIVELRLKVRENLLRNLDYGNGRVHLTEEEIQSELERYREELNSKLNELLDNRGFIEVSPKVMAEYNYRHYNEPTRAVAFYDRNTKNIVVSDADNFIDDKNFSKYLNHEIRHWYDDLFPLTPDEDLYLRQGYNDVFDELPNLYSSYTKGYEMNPERVTTNRDAREVIFLSYFRPKSIAEQNKLIDNIPDEDIIHAVETANGYGQDYIRTLRERNMLTKELVLALRNAMKYVGVSTGAFTIMSKVPSNKKGGRLIPKYQEGGTPNTFIGAVTELLGGDYKKGDRISALASIHPLIGLGLGALDLGYDLNGLKHGEKTYKDVGLDIFSMIPGMRYATKINLLKKSTDPMMYYYKLLSKYLKKHADDINTFIGFGKATDLVDDSTH